MLFLSDTLFICMISVENMFADAFSQKDMREQGLPCHHAKIIDPDGQRDVIIDLSHKESDQFCIIEHTKTRWR